MTLTRQALEERGFRIPPEGGLAVRVREGEVRVRRADEKPEPLAQSIIDAMVARFPLPTKDPALCPRVIGCDPSINEAGFAEVGGPYGTVRTGRFHSKADQPISDRLLALARCAEDFVARAFAPDVAVVEDSYYRPSGKGTPYTVRVASLAVGAVFGGWSRFEVQLVDPSWMPRLLTGRPKGGGHKLDRHRVAQGLLQRAGWEWPEGSSSHEADALCLAVTHLAEEGWL